jgi:hypothetical protein
MRIVSVEETATRLNVRPKSLLDKRFRARIGLAAVHIGRRIGFAEGDIERLIIRGREKLPVGKERGNSRCNNTFGGAVEAPCGNIG